MSAILLNSEQLELDVAHRSNVRIVTRAWLESVWHLRTGMSADGYSDFQIALLGNVFEKSSSQTGHVTDAAFRAIREKVQYLCYPGTYYDRDLDIYWDDDNLVLRIKPTH